MNTQITNLSLNEPEDDSCVSTPTASIQLPRPHRQNEPQPLIDHHRDQQPSSDHAGAFAASLAAMLDESLNLSQDPEPSRLQKSPSPPESNNTQLVLPLPVVPSNKSQTSASHPDATHEEFLVRIADLPPEVTSADISVARESFLVPHGFLFPISHFPHRVSHSLGFVCRVLTFCLRVLSGREFRRDFLWGRCSRDQATLRSVPRSRQRRAKPFSVRHHCLCQPAWSTDVPCRVSLSISVLSLM